MVDDRVPGDPVVETKLYECPICHRATLAERAPKCPDHGVRMELKDELPFQDRRAAIRQARSAKGK